MDHIEAIRLQAAEKYVLRELSPTLMEEYEAHFFDCAECAVDIKAAVAFADASREHFRANPERQPSSQDVATVGSWFRWPKLAFAFGAPVFAALVLLIGYQTFHTSQKSAPQVANVSYQSAPLVASVKTYDTSFPLHGVARGERRGAGDAPADHVSIHSGQNFDLKFDFLPTSKFSQYIGQLQDNSGRVVLRVPVSADMVSHEVHVPVSAGSISAGNYELIIAGDPSATGRFLPENGAARFSFSVEILP
jgi:hypothetical protein